jgi:hypothetical protein
MRLNARTSYARILLVLAAGSGALLALTPRWLFPVCEMQIRTDAGGLIPMRCNWSASMLVALGILAGVLAVAGAVSRAASSARMSAYAASGVFVVALLVPTTLIGVCAAPTHPCRAGTLPASLVVASAGVLFSIAAAALLSIPDPQETAA